MTAIEKLIADYRSLAFPEEDAVVETNRLKRIADAERELGALRRLCDLVVDVLNGADSDEGLKQILLAAKRARKMGNK